MMKFDLHVHSCRSIDSRADFVDIYSAAKRRGLAGLAICDHNHFSPPPPCDGLLIIPACEYSTTAGHLLAFFLRSPLENIISKNDDGLFPWREIVDAAHAQNALVFLAHPYAPARERPRDLWQELDGIEVYNARIAHSRIEHANDDARSTCLLLNKPYSAGSDGHFAGEVGAAFIELECENTLSSVRAALLSKTARVYGGAACSLYRPASQWIKMCDRHDFRPFLGVLARFARAIFSRRPKRGYINMEGAQKQ